MKLDALSEKLGVEINRELLKLALTHRSYSYEHGNIPNNERLEFLGDAILQWTITDRIYQAHPTMNEGELTDLRKSLVNAETLADIAREIQLGQWIQLGAGELSAGGRKKSSILADALEAFIGALYLDGGPDKARAFVIKIMGDRVMSQADRLDEFDARSHLIRVCVREYSRPPLVEIEQTGAAHEPTFTAKVIVNGVEVGCENGRTKKAAAQAASTGANAIGVVQNDVAAGAQGAVKLFFPSQFGIVSAIVTAGNTVFAVTSGLILGTYANASTVTLGVAINSGVAGDVVEYVPKFNQ
jgi:ribonuclease-3